MCGYFGGRTFFSKVVAMIKIENLTKTYKTDDKQSCKALDNVNLILPNRGMIFVLGKSGSGKSTLLNLIGGLDSFDSGDITVFGNALSTFKEKDFEAFRSSCISFIFQDYHLMDELTVKENVLLFSSKEIDDDHLFSILDTVGMREYANRYPSELSGGQRQRVAIARGIVKNPQIILCDEPTGNLDSKTSTRIMEQLKKLSKECLVLIVSHNLPEAETYADRIIELSEGKIINDISKDANYVDALTIRDKKAILPYGHRMNETEVSTLNNALDNGEVLSIEQNPSGFSQSNVQYEVEKKTFTTKQLTKRNTKLLFKKFLFSNKRTSIATILFTALLFAVFAVVQSFTMFQADDALRSFVSYDNSLMVIERDFDRYPLPLYDEGNTLNEEHIYKLYQQPIAQKGVRASSYNGKAWSNEENFADFYIHETYGLLICDEFYLANTFGSNQEIPLLAGSLEDAKNGSGVLITDYFADSILFHEVKNGLYRYADYNSIIGVFSSDGFFPCGYICGIIDTDYTEKYSASYEKFQSLIDSGMKIKDIVKEDEIFVHFIDEVKTTLGISYSLNPNYINAHSFEESAQLGVSGLYISGNDRSTSIFPAYYVAPKRMQPMRPEDFADNEIAIPFSVYNTLFDTNYTKDDTYKLNYIEPKSITVTRYQDNNPKLPVVYEKEFKVVCLSDLYWCMSINSMHFIKESDWIPTRLYVINPTNVSSIVDYLAENDCHLMSTEQQNINQINKVIVSFQTLFQFLEWISVAICAGYIVSYGINSIKKNKYQIGVIKALGGTSNVIRNIFTLKVLTISTLSAIVSMLFASIFIKLSDTTLISALKASFSVSLKGICIIQLTPSVLLLNAAALLVVSLFSALASVFALKHIKPIEIIKAKE